MVILPDDIKIEMQWKQVIYIKSNNYVVFEIIPMLTGKDVVIFPNRLNWSTKQNLFSCDERAEIIFLLERIAWKRDLRIVEMDVPPYVNKKIEVLQGMIESTEGYIRLTRENLFDTDSKLNKNQVKEIYCKLERKFAESAQGVVKIPREILINGSVIKEVCLPVLERNAKVKLLIV